MNKIISIIIIFCPFINLTHALYPVTILGKSFWLVLVVSTIFLFYLKLLFIGKTRVSRVEVLGLVLGIMASIIFVIRWMIYRESVNFLDIRYIFTSLVFIGFVNRTRGLNDFIDSISFSIIWQGILTAIARVVNFYFFPNLKLTMTETEEIVVEYGGELSRDLLMGSSISGNHIICGMVTLLVVFDKRLRRLTSAQFIAIQFFLMLGVFNTFSRFPIFVSVLLFFISIAKARLMSWRGALQTASVFVGILVLNRSFEILSMDFFKRFGDDSGSRVTKVQIAVELISNSISDFMFGSADQMVSGYEIDGVTISDNSYSLVATKLGVPFAFCFFLLILKMMYSARSVFFSKIMFIYLVVALGLTNCILWEPWILTAFLVVAVIRFYNSGVEGKRSFRSQPTKFK
jgi:hypothetical protein